MKNQISPEAIKRGSKILIRRIAAESKNSLEKFLMQQNLIQYHLGELIVLRTRLSDKKFSDWMERMSLGSLINSYKICALQEKNEIILVGLLKKYNKNRNYLVHEIIQDSDYMKVKERAESANKLGIKIIEILDELIKNKKNSDAIMVELRKR